MVRDQLAEILNFFEAVNLKDFENSVYLHDDTSLGSALVINSSVRPISADAHFEMAFVFINQHLDVSGKNNSAPQKIREELYRLKRFASIRIADLGNLKTGKNIHETQFALQEVSALLFQLKVNVVVVGGSQLLTLGSFRAFKEFENNINLVAVDSRIDLATSEHSVQECNYLNAIIDDEAAFVYNIAVLAYQSYFVNKIQLKRLAELYFEHYRLGLVREKIEQCEPVLRDADLVSFDISAIRMADAPGQKDGSPNGLFADEACRLTRYAGLSDRVRSLGLYEVDSEMDQQRQTVKLAAQMLWYYIDGYVHRKHDYPASSLSECTKYEVQIDEIDFPIVFYKSNKSDRWWIEVRQLTAGEAHSETVLAGCTADDYRQACQNEIPERWWLNFKKLK
jgi:arginase family enzyme